MEEWNSGKDKGWAVEFDAVLVWEPSHLIFGGEVERPETGYKNPNSDGETY